LPPLHEPKRKSLHLDFQLLVDAKDGTHVRALAIVQDNFCKPGG
jgi:hypothetical protein